MGLGAGMVYTKGTLTERRNTLAMTELSESGQLKLE